MNLVRGLLLIYIAKCVLITKAEGGKANKSKYIKPEYNDFGDRWIWGHTEASVENRTDTGSNNSKSPHLEINKEPVNQTILEFNATEKPLSETTSEAGKGKSSNHISTTPNYNDNDIWIWGQTEKSFPNRINTGIVKKPKDEISSSLETGKETDLSQDYQTNRDYNATGKRKSEEKCLEYQGDVQLTEIKDKSNNDEESQNEVDPDDTNPWATVLGGRNTFIGEFPHMGAIGWKTFLGEWAFKCGCTLISHQFVLTAAHCTSVSQMDTTIDDPKPKIVRLNTKNISETQKKTGKTPPIDVNIIQIIVHPNYKSPKKYYDIALMKLEREIKFTPTLRPACIWTKNDLSSLGSTAIITGWGVFKSGSLNSSEELQAAKLGLHDSKMCDDLLKVIGNRHINVMMDHQLCAGNLKGGIDSCQGDSGGPLQVKIPVKGNASTQNMYYVIGVTSFGFKCGLSQTPGIYTRISSFVDWIESVVWP